MVNLFIVTQAIIIGVMTIMIVSGLQYRVQGEAGKKLVHATLYTNASDLPASHKTVGLHGYTSKEFMCSLCYQPFASLVCPDCFDSDSKLLCPYDFIVLLTPKLDLTQSFACGMIGVFLSMLSGHTLQLRTSKSKLKMCCGIQHCAPACMEADAHAAVQVNGQG